MTCWHCQSTDGCDCPFCGHFDAGANWMPGPCGFCTGRRKQDELQPKLEAKNNEMMAVNVRYIPPTEKASKLLTRGPRQESAPKSSIWMRAATWRPTLEGWTLPPSGA